MAGSALRGVEVWVARVDAVDPPSRQRYFDWLAPDERLKHRRFATEELREEYLLTRALSRWVLSTYEPSVAPEQWRFERTDSGRPFVVGPSTAPNFNLSNADGLVVCAASMLPVGVDVELATRGEELLKNAPALFSSRENADLLALAPERRARHAVELWTSKEAYLKARGDGISVHLNRLSLMAAPLSWQLDVRSVEAHVLAVAVDRGEGLPVPITLRDAAKLGAH